MITTERYRSVRNLVFLAVLLLQIRPGCAQPPSRAKQEFNKLAEAYHSNGISGKQYLAKADSVIHQLFSEGTYFETRELVDLLDLYEDIAWSDEQYGRARVSYHFLFFNNARMFKKRGASMYYAEKITEEYKAIGQDHPLVEQLQKCKIYQELRLYDKVIDIFNNERGYLESLPGLLQRDQVDLSVGLNAMYILSPVLTGYMRMNDTSAVYQTLRLAKQIGSLLQRNDSLSRTQMLYNDLLMIDMAHSVANFEHRYDSAAILLNHMEALKTTYKDQTTSFIDINLIRLRLENHLNLKNQDSLSTYIAKYTLSTAFGDSQRADVAEFRSKLQAMQGDYHAAYASLSDALKLERDVQKTLMAESSDLLYAYTQAEHSGIALQRAEKVKEQRTLWLVIISLVAILIIAAIYLTMQRRSKKAQLQIDNLNHAANLQIVAMEELKRQTIREEQRRLGQDLHDGLSSSIAGVRHQMEILSLDLGDTTVKSKLKNLLSTVEDAYQAARNKSHQWFGEDEEQQESSFEQRIKVLADKALPDNHYEKEVIIDAHALQHTGLDMRITLLRIIQESLTNVIKHAKANRISILLYREAGHLLLSITDNGKGVGRVYRSRRSGMGLRSMEERLKAINGFLKINTTSAGTEIVATIPVDDPGDTV